MNKSISERKKSTSYTFPSYAKDCFLSKGVSCLDNWLTLLSKFIWFINKISNKNIASVQ